MMKTTTLMRTSLFNRRTFRQGAISAFRSVKMKVLLSFCVVLIVLAFSTHAPSILGWKHNPTAHIGQSSRTRKGYTLLINTWKRNDLLKKSISHYVSCPCLDSIHIVWSEPNPPSDSLVEFLNNVVQSKSRKGPQVELRFDIHKEDSLNNRFKEIVDLKTDALFSIDDDVIFPCKSVELAFTVWRCAPDTMVGFVPRMHWIDKSNGKEDQYIYGGWWSVWWMGKYSMVLSKAAFFHKKYLSQYTHHMPASIREYISRNRNCEDIAMSFLVANATGVPPVWVKGKINEIGSTGISSMGGHSERRTQCVNWFVKEYGKMPLVSTSVKAVDGRSDWFW